MPIDNEGKFSKEIQKLNIIIQSGKAGKNLNPKFYGNVDFRDYFKNYDNDNVKDGLDWKIRILVL